MNAATPMPWPADAVERRPVAALIPYARNARTHSPAQVAQLAASITEWGWTMPILVDEAGTIIAGHGRVLAARQLGLDDVPVMVARGWSEAKRRAYVLADNKLALNAGWDDASLAAELRDLLDAGFDVPLIGFDPDELAKLFDDGTGGGGGGISGAGSLTERFLVPPFTLLNAREGWWQERKRAWLALGLKSQAGRGKHDGGTTLIERCAAVLGADADAAGFVAERQAQGLSDDAVEAAAYKAAGRRRPKAGTAESYPGQNRLLQMKNGTTANADKLALGTGVSIFDPVLCEIAYRWFCPPGGTVIDPFAGGSARGAVAAALGRHYVGCDLNAAQIAANRRQWLEIGGRLALNGPAPAPQWHSGDSAQVVPGLSVEADMLFTCPPYADLEVYSDDPADISAMPYERFRAAYADIIAKACAKLRPDRFAVIVVGDVRDKAGNYRNFVGDTVEAFKAAGLHFYNEAILVTIVGTLAIRAGKSFAATRKLGKTHQNVLVFVKGNAKRATEACGVVDVADALATAAAEAGHDDDEAGDG